MKKLYLFCIFSLFCNCTENGEQRKQPIIVTNTDSVLIDIPLFWKEACRVKRLSGMYDCDQNNKYQIELTSPFKDVVVLTLDLNDSTTDTITYYRFKQITSLHNARKYNNMRNLLKMIDSARDDTIIYLYKNPTQIILKPKNPEINNFFSYLIWDMEKNNEKGIMIDPETWNIKGRFGGKEVLLSRETFKDSLYYTNVQKIIDIFKIEDYNYQK